MKEIKLKGIDESIFYDECKNGLKIYMWVKKNANAFYATLSVKYGSLYNSFKVNNKVYNLPIGVPHFLEHVKFNESKDYTAHDYFNKMGSDTNAFTTFDYTNYQVYGSGNEKENILHLIEFVQNGYFTKNIVDNEKGIIIEEANMGIDDPYTVMLYDHLKNIFHNYSYKDVITGYKEDIKKITLKDVKLAFNTFYHPENMFLVVTGNFNPYEIAESVKELEDKKEFPSYLNPKRIIKKEAKTVKNVYEEKNINVATRKIKIGIKIPKKVFKNYDDLSIRIYLSILLEANFGSTSDFKDELLSKEIINDMVYNYDIFDDYIVIIFIVESNYKNEVINVFNEKLESITITKNSFERMKKARITSTVLMYEDVEVVNGLIQNHILHYGHIIDNVKERYENIKYDEINKFNSLLAFKEKSILILNPLEK